MCEHHHHHEHLKVNDKLQLIKIILAIVFFTLAIVTPSAGIVKVMIFLTAYIIAGGDVVIKAVKNIFKGEIFDENFLMVIATAGAFAIKEYPEAVMVMILYQIG